MRFLALLGLLLLPAFAAAAESSPENGMPSLPPEQRSAGGESQASQRVLDHPALWILGARSVHDAGRLPPELPPDKGRLQFDATGLRYFERSEDRFPELLSVSYDQIAGVIVDASTGPHVTLFVTTAAEAATGDPVTHLFLILDSGSVAAAAFAAEARALIQARTRPAERVLAQPGLEQSPSATGGKVAIAVAPRQPAVSFTTPSEPGTSSAFVESVTAGAKIGIAPLMVCSYGGCTAAGLWVPALAAAGAGVIGGAVVGVIREIVNAASGTQPPPAFAPAEIESATPALDAAAAGALAEPALLRCVRGKLFPEPAGTEPAATINGGLHAAPAALVLDVTPPPHADLVRDGYRYLVEAHLSRVTLVPAGKPGQKPEHVLAVLLVEGGLSVIDLPRNTSQDRAIAQYRTEARTLREWSASGGAAFGEELKRACDEFGSSIAAEAAKLHHGQ